MEDPLQCVMTCHVPHAAAEALRFRSCISFLRRVPFRSMPSAPPPAWAPSSGGTLFARVSCLRARARARARLAPARFAHLIARARRRAPVPSASGAVHGRPPALCHDMSCSSCRRRSSAVPFLHIAPPSRSVPLPAVRAAAARLPGAAGPFLRAYRACAPAPVPARVSAGAVRAPDCARETADARLLSVPAGAFFGPSHCFPVHRKAKRRPRKPPSLYSSFILQLSLQSSPLAGKYENFSNFLPQADRRRPGCPPLPRGRQGAERGVAEPAGAPDIDRQEMCAFGSACGREEIG